MDKGVTFFSSRSTAIQSALIYGVFGLVWIYVSDPLLGMMVKDPDCLSVARSCKSIPLILVTAFFVYYLIRHHGAQEQVSHAQRIQSENALALLFSALPLGAGRLDHRHFTMANQQLCEITGYELDELMGQSIRKLYPDQAEYDRVGRELYQETALGGKFFIRSRWQHKKGHVFDVLIGGAASPGSTSPTDIVFTIMDITREQEQGAMYQILFEGAHDAMFLMDSNKFLDCNPRALALFNAAREDLIHASPLDFSPEHQPNGRPSKELAKAQITAALAGTPQIFEWRHCRKDGSPFDAEISLNAIKIGGETYLLALARDITTRVFQEKARLRNERITQVLYRITNAVNASRNMDELYTAIHEILSEHIDAANFYIARVNTEKDCLDFPIFIDQKDSPYPFQNISNPEVTCLTLEVIRGGKPLLVREEEGKTRAGAKPFDTDSIRATRPAVWLGVPLAVKDTIIGAMAVKHYTDPRKYGPEDRAWLSTVAGQVAMAIDRKQTIAALQNRENYLQSIFRAAPTGIGVLKNRIIVTANQRFCDILGYPREEIEGQSTRKLYVSEAEYHRCGQEIYASINTSGLCAVEARIRRKSGRQILLLLSASLLNPGDSEDQRITFSILDITEHKRMEEELRHSSQELEETVEKRTRELTAMVNALKKRNLESDILSKLGDLLQTCETEKESYHIFSSLCSQVFSAHSGLLAVHDKEIDAMLTKAVFGPNPPQAAEFRPAQCWALRRSGSHLVMDPQKDPVCDHTNILQEQSSLCVSIGTKGKATGLLHLVWDAPPDTRESLEPDQAEQELEAFTGLARRVAELYGLSLANIQLRSHLRQQSICDQLTGLYNRRYMEESLSREVARARRNQTGVGIILIDVDYFKNFNDKYGHDAGDQVLRRLGSYLNSQTRGEDIACRYGGEELLVILPGCTLSDAALRAENIRSGIEALGVHYGGIQLKVTASLGVAAYPDHGQSFQGVITTADAALYRAKEGGRNQVMAAPD